MIAVPVLSLQYFPKSSNGVNNGTKYVYKRYVFLLCFEKVTELN